MEITVNLFGNLGHYVTEGGNRNFFTKTLPEGSTVEQLLHELGLQGKVQVVVVVNGDVADAARVLKEKDAVSVFRPSGGG
jgi:sulfur carrier protein ThiS